MTLPMFIANSQDTSALQRLGPTVDTVALFQGQRSRDPWRKSPTDLRPGSAAMDSAVFCFFSLRIGIGQLCGDTYICLIGGLDHFLFFRIMGILNHPN